MLSLSGENSAQFPSFEDRLSRTWDRVKTKAGPLFLISFAFASLNTLLQITTKKFFIDILTSPDIVSLGQKIFFPIFFTVLSYLMALMLITLLTIGTYKTSFQEAIAFGVRHAHALLWILLLSITIVTAGTLFFIIPGIILSLRFGMSMPVLVSERQHGISALVRSRQLLYGYTLRWFFHAVLLTILLGFPSFILFYLLTTFEVRNAIALSSLANQLIGIFTLPLFIMFTQIFYEDIVQEKKDLPATTGHRRVYGLLSFFGAITLLAALFSLVFFRKNILEKQFFLPSPAKQIQIITDSFRQTYTPEQRDTLRYQDVVVLRLALQTYVTRQKAYPQRLAMLVPDDLAKIPSDPTTGQPYLYTTDGNSYKILFVLEKGVSALGPGTHTATAEDIDPPPPLPQNAPEDTDATINESPSPLQNPLPEE